MRAALRSVGTMDLATAKEVRFGLALASLLGRAVGKRIEALTLEASLPALSAVA
jgi:hypothetical protein